ncbi:DNA polymerase III, delta subunit [Rubidibacter lacunae KORDI 51-2]|uniref:DNA polymerase III subunit delta n=1 Tax=Rubidibacter lacunae KORDI 51-2 TaxID=582515 RepID=U5DI71_9CHRO|nr:DNA polymerase III subunit delta [Rubidibacter lacunae]ERN40299.1 DNA polymerase III, delta subunit [Rubidibacter lacunae KORDI 51-2]
MPIYLYWGDDDYAIARAARTLQQRVLDPAWSAFNANKLDGRHPEAASNAIAQALTPPFGNGGRFVWLADTDWCQRCPEPLLSELTRTLPQLPPTTTFLLSTLKRPDGRLKSTKLLQRHARFTEFASIPPWKTEALLQRARQAATEANVRLDRSALEHLAATAGSDSRQLAQELEKLHLYGLGRDRPLDADDVAALVSTNTHNSLQLADAIRSADTARALTLVSALLARNEPPLRILATLTGRFRIWLRVKLAIACDDRDDRAVAAAAEIGNPKRLYFLRQDVQPLSIDQLRGTLALFLELELALKRGSESAATLQRGAITACRWCASPPTRPPGNLRHMQA